MSAEVTIKFDDDRVRRAIAEASTEALNIAASVLQATIKRNFGSEGGGVLGKRLYHYKKLPANRYHTDATGHVVKFYLDSHGRPVQIKNKPGKGRNVFYPAPPGKFPGVRLQTLRNSIQIEPATPTQDFALVGTPLKYGRWLEFGTKKMAARPWIVRSMNESAPALRAAFAKTFSTSLASKLR